MNTKRFRIILAILLVGIVSGVAWQVLRPREPAYQGKPLTTWLQGYLGNPNETQHRKADEAVRQIGTNAIPILLELLRAKDSALRLRWIYFTRRLRVIRWPSRLDPILAQFKNIEGAEGLRALGLEAQGAVPSLVELYRLNPYPGSRSWIIEIWGSIGPAAKEAIPSLLAGAADPDPSVRSQAVWVLGKIHAAPELVVPAMTTSLQDPDVSVRRNAAAWLGNFGTVAKPAVPALLQLLNDKDQLMRDLAGYSLKKIDPEAAAQAGVK